MNTEVTNQNEQGNQVAVSNGSGYAVVTVDKDELAEIIRENVGVDLNIFDLDRLKIPAAGGTHWTVSTLQGDEMVKHIDGILIQFYDVRGYWASDYEDNPGQPPDCHSHDCVTGVGNPGGDCLKCPLAQFESADKGGGQACTNSRRLFLITEGSLLPVMITCPPTSLKNARRYCIKLAGFNVPYYSVITRLKLSQDKNADGVPYSKVEFETVGQLGPEELIKIKEFRAMIVGGLSSIPIDGDYRVVDNDDPGNGSASDDEPPAPIDERS